MRVKRKVRRRGATEVESEVNEGERSEGGGQARVKQEVKLT